MKHHKFGMSESELDELFVRDAFVHIERMDETAFWIGVNPPKGSPLPSLSIRTGVERGVWYFNVDEACDDGRSLTVERPRNRRERTAKRGTEARG